MEIVQLKCPNLKQYKDVIFSDILPSTGCYEVERGMEFILETSLIPFDYYNYLHTLAVKAEGRKLMVLEGGCGIGNALVDLKRGITFNGGNLRWRDLEAFSDLAKAWKIDFIGTIFPGLEDLIETTGITLSINHTLVAKEVEEIYRIDKLIVGALSSYVKNTNDSYDFIFDSLGVAFHFPEEAIEGYSQLLREGCLGIAGFHGNNPRSYLKMLKDYNFKAIEVGESKFNHSILQVLFQKE